MDSSSSREAAPATGPAKAGRSGWRANLLKIALSVSVLGVLFWKLNAGEVWTQLTHAAVLPLSGAVLILLAQTGLMAWRWQHLGRRIAHAAAADYPTFANHWRILISSLWFGLALPSSLGSDAVRVLMLNRQGIRLGLATRGVLLDRISALAAVSVMILFCIPGLAGVAKNPDLTNSLLALSALGFLGLVVLLNLDRIVGRWRSNRLLGFVTELAVNARTIFRMPEIAGIAVVIHLMTAAAFYAVSVSTGLGVGAVPILLIVPPIILLSALPLSISGWGVREGAFVVGLGLFNVGPAAALAASILFGLCATAVGIAGGIVWLASRKADARALQDI